VTWSEGFGLANVELGVAVTPLTRFRLGSVSKVLTAAGIGRLVEDGKLDLDAPVQKYLPGYPLKPWPITIRQLAGHIAGVRHYTGTDFAGALKGAPHFETAGSALAVFKDDPLIAEPGTRYSYSSYGWNLIAAVIEAAAGEEFLSFMQKSVFEPIGLRQVAPDHVFEIVPNRTAFYKHDIDRKLLNANHVDNSYKWAGGGFLSNAEDLVRFGLAHLKPGFFQQETLDLLFRSQKLKSGKETGVGIAWRSGIAPDGLRILHHGGSIEGGRAMLMMFPDKGLVVALLSNLRPSFGEEDAIKLGKMFI